MIEYFLYCLEQLGIKDLKENFKGDHAAAFGALKAEREKLMRESTAFKAMKDGGDEAKP